MSKEEKPPPVNETAVAIHALATEMAKQMAANNPSLLSMTGMSPEAQRALVTPPPPKGWRMIPGRSAETGATFTMHVQVSRKHPDGVITQLHNYRHPPGTFTHEQRNNDGEPLNDGIVPQGMPILRDETVGVAVGQEPPAEMLSPHYKQWRYENFYKKDLAYYIGRVLRAEFCEPANGIQTPWIPGTSGGVIAEAAE
jgi:hypothetical protein